MGKEVKVALCYNRKAFDLTYGSRSLREKFQNDLQIIYMKENNSLYFLVSHQTGHIILERKNYAYLFGLVFHVKIEICW